MVRVWLKLALKVRLKLRVGGRLRHIFRRRVMHTVGIRVGLMARHRTGLELRLGLG